MLGRFLVGLLVLLGAGMAWGGPASPQSGGVQVRAAATGWFRTQKFGTRWWLVDPQGQGFFSLGVNDVTLGSAWSAGDAETAYRAAALQKYGSRSRWAKECASRLREWGFTTVGIGSDPIVYSQHQAYLLSLELSSALRLPEDQRFPDVFSPAFSAGARKVANRLCRPRADDPWLLGYVSDSNLPWSGPESEESLFVQFLRLGDASPGRAALVGFLEDRYLEVEALNEAWHAEYAAFGEVGRVPQAEATIPADDEEEFGKLVAEQYFRVTHDAIRGVDPNHLIFGGRFPAVPSRGVLEVMRDYVDAVCLRASGALPPAAALRVLYQAARLPVLIGEFSAGPDDADRRALAAEGEAADEEARGQHYERYLTEAASLPMVIGCHWASYTDSLEATLGLVNQADDSYGTFVESVVRANREACLRHAGEKVPRKVSDGGSARRVGAR